MVKTENRIGLVVGRFQPLHLGHCATIHKMIQECQTAIVCVGSSQLSKEKNNPYTVEERMNMLRNVYGERIKIIPLADISAATQRQWVDYICDKVSKLGLERPTDYYTGSQADAEWYKHFFFNPKVSAFTVDTIDEYKGRKLHIIDREKNVYPSGTELRLFLETRNTGWKKWVPAVNHNLVESSHPEILKVPLDEE